MEGYLLVYSTSALNHESFNHWIEVFTESIKRMVSVGDVAVIKTDVSFPKGKDLWMDVRMGYEDASVGFMGQVLSWSQMASLESTAKMMSAGRPAAARREALLLPQIMSPSQDFKSHFRSWFAEGPLPTTILLVKSRCLKREAT